MPRRPPADRLRVPTSLLLAGKSRAHDVRKVAARAHALVPGLTSTILPDVAHHSVPTEHPERLNEELTSFLDQPG
jgi:pimeloyl-ACP methyl ester carboxylesterase